MESKGIVMGEWSTSVSNWAAESIRLQQKWKKVRQDAPAAAPPPPPPAPVRPDTSLCELYVDDSRVERMLTWERRHCRGRWSVLGFRARETANFGRDHNKTVAGRQFVAFVKFLTALRRGAVVPDDPMVTTRTPGRGADRVLVTERARVAAIEFGAKSIPFGGLMWYDLYVYGGRRNHPLYTPLLDPQKDIPF